MGYMITETVRRSNNTIFGFVLADGGNNRHISVLAKDAEKYVGKDEVMRYYEHNNLVFSLIEKKDTVYVLQNKKTGVRAARPITTVIEMVEMGNILVDNAYVRESAKSPILVMKNDT